MTEEIIIDGIKYFKQSDINKGLDEEHYVTEFHLLATHYNLLLEDYARKYNSLKGQLKRKEQECKNLEEELRGCRIGIKDISIESTEICKISEKYKQALDNIEARIQLENADDCLLDVMEIIESVKGKNNDSLPTKVLCKLHKTSI